MALLESSQVIGQRPIPEHVGNPARKIAAHDPEKPPIAITHAGGGCRSRSAMARYSQSAVCNSVRRSSSCGTCAAVAFVFARIAARHDRKSGINGMPPRSIVSDK